LTDPSEFQAEVVYGRVPPQGADQAAAALAAEIARGTGGGDCVLPADRGPAPPQGADAAAGGLAGESAGGTVGGDCALPAEVVQVVREGVTYRTVDAKELFRDGLSGVARTDRWLAAEAASRKPGVGFSDPTVDPSLARLGTDTG